MPKRMTVRSCLTGRLEQAGSPLFSPCRRRAGTVSAAAFWVLHADRMTGSTVLLLLTCQLIPHQEKREHEQEVAVHLLGDLR